MGGKGREWSFDHHKGGSSKWVVLYQLYQKRLIQSEQSSLVWLGVVFVYDICPVSGGMGMGCS